MAGGFNVDPEQLREHAGKLEQLQDRFEAVRAASSHIAQDDEAYGTLCGWIAGCLEERHGDQDQMVDRAANNLGLAARAVRACADDYEAGDDDASTSFQDLESRMGS